MIDYLRQQNSKLQDEVAALKERLEQSSGFGSSPSSTVGGSGSGPMGDSHRLDRPGRQGSRTPRAAVREVAVSPERVSKRDHPMGLRFLMGHHLREIMVCHQSHLCR